MSETEDVWNRLIDDVAESIGICIEEGKPRRITLGSGKESVTIDIYRSKASMKKFDELMIGAVKEQTGIDIIKKDPTNAD